ncbi:hypothetical protein MTBSS4_40147 [Magnetospirillum sp. SS-4]|nr:hypothetical protein MTBSS4_40147 [Magnetospirillum sp. SS-4]
MERQQHQTRQWRAQLRPPRSDRPAGSTAVLPAKGRRRRHRLGSVRFRTDDRPGAASRRLRRHRRRHHGHGSGDFRRYRRGPSGRGAGQAGLGAAARSLRRLPVDAGPRRQPLVSQSSPVSPAGSRGLGRGAGRAAPGLRRPLRSVLTGFGFGFGFGGGCRGGTVVEVQDLRFVLQQLAGQLQRLVVLLADDGRAQFLAQRGGAGAGCYIIIQAAHEKLYIFVAASWEYVGVLNKEIHPPCRGDVVSIRDDVFLAQDVRIVKNPKLRRMAGIFDDRAVDDYFLAGLQVNQQGHVGSPRAKAGGVMICKGWAGRWQSFLGFVPAVPPVRAGSSLQFR